MIIEIPKGYIFTKEDDIIAFEENGKLKLRAWGGKLNDIMYDLTYKIKGETVCYYCGKEVRKSKMTLDHVYPRSLGGPTLPENLVPACKDCNNGQKGDMTPEQYRIYRNLHDTDRKREFLREFNSVRMFQERWLHILPEEWTTKTQINELILLINLHDSETTKYKKTEQYYLRCGQFPKPIIIDCHRFVLDGFTQVLYAKNHNIREIPTIVLENVEVILE